MEIIYLIIGLLIGAAAGWAVSKYKYESTKGVPIQEAEELRTQINSLIVEKGKLSERNSILDENLNKTLSELAEEREKVSELRSVLSSTEANYKNLQEKLAEQKDDIEKLQEKFTSEFEVLANKILEEKSNKFTQQNKENLDTILKPLSEKIKDFEKKVDDVYVSDSKERAGLVQQIKMLHELNQQMSKDASNLTSALKGQTKTQGSWGEFILESILEKSGLSKGREFLVQESLTSEDGKRFQPDVIVNLPENKSIVIDSKVSLNAYERYISGEDENEKQTALRDHIISIRKHIKDLSSKNYQNLYQLQSLDFVLLFMPIEPAFNLAVQNDNELFNEALEKHIVIVNPSTLLATLRTIASIWKHEKQNKNALEIARQSGALYDKFEGLVKDLIDVGNKLQGTRNSYEDAMKKLHTGSGNLLSRVERIKKLGAKTTKQLPQSLLDRLEDDSEDETENGNELQL